MDWPSSSFHAACSQLSVLRTGIGALAQRLVAVHSLGDDEERVRNLVLEALMQMSSDSSLHVLL